MKVVIQRSLTSTVYINNQCYSSIDKGLVLLVSFCNDDSETDLIKMVNKITKLRIFDDEEGIMNKSVIDIKGEILSVSQFTLYADTSSGNRPSYTNVLKSEKAEKLYDKFNQLLNEKVTVKTGIFKENMKVNINNDGPVTFVLESR